MNREHATPNTSVAPLSTVLILTWINSLATGIPYNGIFFIAKNVYNFGNTANCLLGVVLGITYIIGALGTGPLVKWLRAKGLVRGARDMLVWLAVLMALLCLLPLGALFAVPPERRADGAWTVWVFIALYSILCGGFWPIVESFLAGGRNAEELRGATGKFNITWSSALIISLWSLVPFEAAGQAQALGVSAAMHMISLIWILSLPREAGTHAHVAHDSPPIYPVLLRVHRILLPTAYLVMYALSPLLPMVISSLGVAAKWEPAVASVWLAARVVTFTIMERRHGWHGRWITATLGTALLLGGFAVAMISPQVPVDGLRLWVLMLGLAGFGAGAATIYCAALYYAMEVGSAEVEAGGMHEAMIGVGYTLGPICGLIPALALPAAWSANQGWATLGLVGGFTVLALGAAFRAARRR